MNDHEWSDRPICPHCSHQFRDTFEWHEEGQESEEECPVCLYSFWATRHIIERWSTRKKEV